MNIRKELKKIVDIGSRTSLVLSEFLAVIAGKKPVLIAGFHSESGKELIKSNFPNLTLFCGEIIIGNKQKNLCVISRNKSFAKQAIECLYSDNKKMGQLLGYPKCCIEKYLQVFNTSEISTNSPTITHQSYRNAKKCNFLTNNLFNFSSRIDCKKEQSKLYSQYRGLNNKEFFISSWNNLQFISHIPCSYDCKKSIKIGEEIDSLLKKYAPDIEKIIRYTLSKPILFFDLFKLVVFDGHLKGDILYYNKIIPPYFPLENLLMKKIKNGNKVVVTKSKVEIFKNNLSLFVYQKKNETDGFILDFSED